MGLLNNDNYIDPFKGADYIDPGKNAEKLSSNVDREHAQREAYEMCIRDSCQPDHESLHFQAPYQSRSPSKNYLSKKCR